MKRTFLLILLTVSLFTFPPHIATADITEWGLPEGAVMRLGKGAISGNIAYSPDGTRLAVSSVIGIWIYDTPKVGKNLTSSVDTQWSDV